MNNLQADQDRKPKIQPAKRNKLILWNFKLIKRQFAGMRQEDLPEERYLVEVRKKVYRSNRKGVKLVQDRKTIISMDMYGVLVSFSRMVPFLQKEKEKGLLLKSPDEGIEIDVDVRGIFLDLICWFDKHIATTNLSSADFECLIEDLDLRPKRGKKRRRED
ncbi:Oidioi.mRNA.OKI2018_I69.PAR.g11492.t1.cds [Oikopleura dioica]|uniref:Oidioi.mRNA.OKI2018_I69.PAR.g11492.t1.cds n=1 Tax=Oikopleura dioica TaxID=34765 RepID=A0ABN7S367_OIKDI|nr:Oidioi.mRNA.OKI2018_I69.PAR.g11492.t1.cds [Oikopleura dioica]